MAPRSPTPRRPGAASRLQAPPPAAQAEWGGAQGRGVCGNPRGGAAHRDPAPCRWPPGGGGEGPPAALSPRAPLRARPVERSASPPASMQPRPQALPAPGPGGPRPAAPLLALLLLLALRGSAAAPAGSEGPQGSAAAPEGPQDSAWQRDSELPHGLLQRAARAALHFFNFRAGSPSALRVLAAVQQGRAWINSKKECQVDLEFTTEHYNPEEGEERLGKCSAQVFFKNEKPRPTINVTCTRFMEKSKRQQEDYLLYKHMKQLKDPLDVISIPDSHGHIDPSLRPIWDLAFLGSSYVMWEKTTQFLHYYMAQLSSVKQWKTDEDAIDFDYTVLLHEFSTQEIIPCRIHLVWHPSKPLKVKYHCQGPQAPEEASGIEEGSAAAPTTGLTNY